MFHFHQETPDNLMTEISGNVLLITSRRPRLTLKLHRFLQEKTDVNIIDSIFVEVQTSIRDACDDIRDYRRIIKDTPIDYVFIVGYMSETFFPFGIIDHIHEENPNVRTIFYATLTNDVIHQAKHFKTMFLYDRQAPLEKLLKFMQGVKHFESKEVDDELGTGLLVDKNGVERVWEYN